MWGLREQRRALIRAPGKATLSVAPTRASASLFPDSTRAFLEPDPRPPSKPYVTLETEGRRIVKLARGRLARRQPARGNADFCVRRLTICMSRICKSNALFHGNV